MSDADSDWGVSRSGYKEDGIYSKSTDGNGHSDLLHLKIPPNVNARIAEVCQDIKTYRTTHDFIRDAVIHRLHWYAEAKKSGRLSKPKLDFLIVAQELDRMAAEADHIKTVIAHLPQQLAEAKKDKDRVRFAGILEMCDTILIDDTVGEPWWSEIRAIIDKEGNWDRW